MSTSFFSQHGFFNISWRFTIIHQNLRFLYALHYKRQLKQIKLSLCLRKSTHYTASLSTVRIHKNKHLQFLIDKQRGEYIANSEFLKPFAAAHCSRH